MKKLLAILIASAILISVFILPVYALNADLVVLSVGDNVLEGDEDGDDGGGNVNPTEPSLPANAYDLSVNGEFFTADKLTISCGNGTAVFDPPKNILTLNSVEMRKTAFSSKLYKYAAISSAIPDLTVVLNGKNVYDEGKSENYFLRSSGSVTFTGSGSAEMYKTVSVEHETYIEAETRWEVRYTEDRVRTDVAVEVDSNITFDNTEAERFFVKSTGNGDLSVHDSALTRCELKVPGIALIENAVILGEWVSDRLDQSEKLYRCSVDSGDTLTVKNSLLEDCSLNTDKDLTMASCSFYGTDMRINGSFMCDKTIGSARHEGQNSTIRVNGPKTNITECEFRGIAETDDGLQEVFIPGSVGTIPMTTTFKNETFSGVFLRLESKDDPTFEADFINSSIIMDSVSVADPDLKIKISDSVFMLCNSDFGTLIDYDYDNGITLSDNIGIVAGDWGCDYLSGGILIDVLDGYIRYDEERGELYLNNDYGVRGWLQRTDYIRSGSLVKITFDKNVTYIGSDSNIVPLFVNCSSLKELVIKSEQIKDVCFIDMQNDLFGENYMPDLVIFVPVSLVDSYKKALPDYASQIIVSDFSDKPNLLGDTDGDGEVEIRDATWIQRKLNMIEIPFAFVDRRADIDKNGIVDITDATLIQRYLIGINTNYCIGKEV